MEKLLWSRVDLKLNSKVEDEVKCREVVQGLSHQATLFDSVQKKPMLRHRFFMRLFMCINYHDKWNSHIG